MASAMGGQGFITRPVSTCLDALRILSALLVLIGHAVQIGLYSGPYPFTIRLQHNCVVVFFVLSGLVIGESVRRDGATLPRYALARFARIVPVAIPAIALGALVFLIAQAVHTPEFHPAHHAHLTLRATLLPMLFLSESPFGEGPVWNAPYWSLCFEVWYYALFGAAVFLRGARRIAALALGAVLAGPNILILWPVWLCGIAVGRFGAIPRLSPVRGVALIAAGGAACSLIAAVDLTLLFALRPLVPWSLGMAEWVLSDLLLAGACALALVGLRPVADRLAAPLQRIERPLRRAAGGAFSIYLFHWPLLCLLRVGGVTRLTASGPALLWLGAVLATCLGLAELTERRTPALRRALERALARPPRHPAAA